MKIGLYKIGYVEKDIDKNGACLELKMLRELFWQVGDDVVAIKDFTDEQFDVIYVLNGVGLDEHRKLQSLRNITKKLNFILTDIRLKPQECHIKLFDNIYTQTSERLFNGDHLEFYNGIPELALYGKIEHNDFENKDIDFIFGGSAKNRVEDIEYYIEPFVYQHGLKTKLLLKHKSIDDRVDIAEYHNLLARSKFSLIIAEKECNDVGFITWRFYENLAKGVISFFDHKFDKHNLIDKKGFEFLVVRDAFDLISKIKIFKEKKLFEFVLSEMHRKYVTLDTFMGYKTHLCLTKGGIKRRHQDEKI